MESREHQTDILANHEYDNKLEKIPKSETDQLEKYSRNEVYRKGHNVEVSQESIQIYKANENEENEKRTIIKVEKFEFSDDILPQIAIEHYEQEQSSENQTNVLLKLEHLSKKQNNLLDRKTDQLEETKKNEGYRKAKDEFGHNVEVSQESMQNYEADENEETGKRTIIKVEKFECSDDILPEITVEHNELEEQSKENQTKVLLKSDHLPKQLDNVLDRKKDQLEESKKNEGHRKVKDEFEQNVEVPEESIQNHEADENEENEKRTIINVEKSECSDDILPQITVEHYESELSKEIRTNVLVKLEHLYDKLSQTSQVILNEPEECEGIQGNKDCTTIVTSAVYEVSSASSSLTKPYLNQRRRGGNVSETQSHKVLNVTDSLDNTRDNFEDTVCNEWTQDADRISVNIETSKVLVTDSKCYVVLEKLCYKCDICRYVTVIKESLVSHMKFHDYKQSDSLSECELQLKNQMISEKYEHKQLHNQPFSCNFCSYKSAVKSRLQRHQLTHTGEMPFACNLYSYKSALKASLQKHLLTHTSEKPFACNFCSYKSARKLGLQTHQLTHTGERPFACNLCLFKTAYKTHLKSHKLTHTGEKPFACNLCSYKSTRKSSLQRHQITHTGEWPFACNLCSYRSVLKAHLQRHQMTHTGEKPFACNLCSYKSTLKSLLNIHKLTHTGEKPFACNLCSFKSVYKAHLQRHHLTHTGEKPFACNLCSYKSARKSDLKRHIFKHTGEWPFACNLCSYRSVHKAHLQRHQMTHTGEKPFACNLCSYKSAYKTTLKTHQLKAHLHRHILTHW